MNESDYTYSSIPNDVALKIASSLAVTDLSCLSCCSRVWRDLWGSDCLWEPLFKQRWPLLYEDVLKVPDFKGWRGFYIKQHKEMKDQADSVIKFVENCLQSESIQVNDYLKAIECQKLMGFGFKDVQMLLLKPKLNVLLNLVGLHYCLNILKVPASDVMEALKSSNIKNRQICIKWWKLGRWFYGFRMRDEFHFRCLSLEDLASSKDDLDGLGCFNEEPFMRFYKFRYPLLVPEAIPGPNQSSQAPV
ncbi:hypothetical protein ES319_A10G110400v1 [Gossypium barbadense]|uniref:F-box domain-containing protein n=1 Tax=Gossypium barbadense TaxID=3634 RepID=A0A5J5U1F2_GOSBA|nr:hypothetical protein ES319_A10G110400v1 [Gossypium barbadense]